MPGRYQPPSVGERPAKAQEIMSAVYEKARAEGYPKARAAKIGWGAVKRAGYDMDEVYGYDPAFVPRRSRILGGARRAVRSGQRLRGRLSSLRSPRLTRQPRQPKRTTTPSPTRRPSYIADPAKLVKPIDIPGYDNLNNVRFVPKDDSPGYYPTRGLVEGQIVLPQNQFLRSLEVIEANPEYSHVELNDEDGDGFIDRFVVRGPKDEKRPKKQNVGLFVDIAKPLKNERLAMENWSLT